jgi:hypothetical protein
MEIKEIRIIRKVLFGLIFIGFIIFIFYQIHKDKKSKIMFSNEVYKGIVEDEIYGEMKRGFPDYLINGQWVYFGGFFSGSKKIIEVGDSLVKEKGDITVKVYSKNNTGDWILKYPRFLKQENHKDSLNQIKIP